MIFQTRSTKYIKATPRLEDTEGRKINYKVRRDSKGLYIKKQGMIGRLKTIRTICDWAEGKRRITTTRRVTSYTSAA